MRQWETILQPKNANCRRAKAKETTPTFCPSRLEKSSVNEVRIKRGLKFEVQDTLCSGSRRPENKGLGTRKPYRVAYLVRRLLA